MASLFAVAVIFALHTVDQQRRDDHLLSLGTELRLLQQQLSMQAMSYKENAPRDYDTYFRDTRLYYRQLIDNRERIGQIISAFATRRLPASLQTDREPVPALKLSSQTRQLARKLKSAWDEFERQLDQKLGDTQEPRLEWGAEWILAGHPALKEAAQTFLDSLEGEIETRGKQAQDAGRLLLTAGLIVALLIVFWFYRRVLGPMQITMQGFRQVAAGDFSYRVKSDWDNEIGWLINVFNQLTERLDALLQLLTRLQETRTLDESLMQLSTVLDRLVPVDWVGMLLVTPDGRMRLERAYSDGNPEDFAEQTFSIEGTLLQECLNNGSPLHIANVDDTARLDSHYRFLSLLAGRGRHDAVFMPILGNEPKVGVLVLASRHPNSYRPEQIRLLHNLSALFSATFGRTVALVESSRLASIGQFASGIVHEIRTPLGTIGMALDHLESLEQLPDGARRRVNLAYAESKRLGRLLDDILLYAKPLELTIQSGRLADIFSALEGLGHLDHPHLHMDETALQALPPIPMDRDRIQQVLLNLLRNAIEANGSDPRGIQVLAGIRGDKVMLEMRNGGACIPPDALKRLFEPFYTSKSSGTGLGLPIVRRILEMHAGSISISSDEATGTRVEVLLPMGDTSTPAGQD